MNRRILLPDLDGDLTAALDRAGELLLTVRDWAGDTAVADVDLPRPLADGQASEAVGRLVAAVRPTQRSPMRLLAPNGRYEHAPLTIVEVDERDLDVLGQTARYFQRAVDPQSQLSCRAEIRCIIDDALTGTNHANPQDAVDELVRLHRLLSLPWNSHCDVLADALAHCRTADVRLDVVGEVAYQALAVAFNNAWSEGSELDFFLY